MPLGTEQAGRAVGRRLRHCNAVTKVNRRRFRGRLRVSSKVRCHRNKDAESISAEICHEIRSPLGSLILAAMRLAEAADLQVEHARDAKRLRAAGERILDLLGDPLLPERNNVNSVNPVVMKVEVHSLLQDLLLLIEQKAQDASVVIHFVVEQNAPIFLISNKGYLIQIVTNLVENAIRHAGCSNIMITVSAVQDGFCQICVEDDGRGKDAMRRRALMSTLVQPATSGRKRGCCGLGLRISNRLAGMLNGRLSVDAATGGGLCATLTVPISMR